ILPVEGQAGLAVHGGIIARAAALEVAWTPGCAIGGKHQVCPGDTAGSALDNAASLLQNAKPVATEIGGGEIGRIDFEIRRFLRAPALCDISLGFELIAALVPGAESVGDMKRESAVDAVAPACQRAGHVDQAQPDAILDSR